MLITKEIEIDMGHRVCNHKSKCRNLHGHRYKIEVGVDDKVVATKGSSDEGMVIDFGDLKQIMMDYIDTNFDHGFVLYEKDPEIIILDAFQELKDRGMKIIFVDFIPTAENLAKYWYQLMEIPLRNKRIKIHHVRVWETPTSTATYSVDN